MWSRALRRSGRESSAVVRCHASRETRNFRVIPDQTFIAAATSHDPHHVFLSAEPL